MHEARGANPFARQFFGLQIEAVIAVALALGILESLVTGYVSSSLRDAVAFFVLIGVLYLRPDGLFGSYAT